MERIFFDYSKRAKLCDIEGFDNRLVVNSLYMQATIGDCNTTEPSYLDTIGNCEWRHWNRLRGMSQHEAMKKYIDYVENFI